ncbi:TenA family transcriptional regulator [Gulosibacter chungangensis]|uniref:Aminopyrimidine aminohydrolase n=1 Tax=Gulosibacter chungangensis TaxID=979746 RepID=A0A7J5BG85_9MICO|nr:TenA family transcriptional regulator [Gulosibacter chungangensis]
MNTKGSPLLTTRFTEELRNQNLRTWEAAVGHQFVKELFDGSIDDTVMAGYLTQDYRFLDAFLALIGAAVASADTLEARLTLARFAGEVAGDENTYFQHSFDTLGVTEELRRETPNTAATTGFQALFREAADTREYAAILSVLVVAEWLYLDWATRVSHPRPTDPVHADWITLHDYPGFHELVAFLRAELDRVGPQDRDTAGDFFGRAVDLELAFFDAAYAHPLTEAGREVVR